MSERPYKHQALSGERSIRLLRLKPVEESRLSGELFEASLDEPVAYETVSYVRGLSDAAGIRIGDQGYLQITPSCEEALVGLYRDRPPGDHGRILWVDAVCVDGENVSEKNGQIAMMEDIYGRSAQTTAWLGPGDEETDQVIDKLHVLKRHFEGLQTSEEERKKYSEPNFPTRNGYCMRTYDFIHGLLDREWFSRAWTIQEASLAKKMVLRVGESSLDWETLVKYGMPQYLESPIPKGSRLDGFNLRTTLVRFRALAQTATTDPVGLAATEAIPLTDIFFTVKKQSAADARDKVNAIWWVSRLSGVSLPPPDYSKPPGQVFTEAVAACARKDKTLGFLYMVSGNREASGPHHPSWVPDFESRDTRWRDLFDVDKRAIESANNPARRAPPAEGNGAGNAGDTTSPLPTQFALDTGAGTLRLSGRILGTLDRAPVRMPRRYSRAELKAPSWDAAVDYVRTLRAAMDLLDAVGLGGENIATTLVNIPAPLERERRVRAWEEEWADTLRRPDSEFESMDIETFEKLRAAYDAPSWRHKSIWFFEEVYGKEEGLALTKLAEFKRLVRLWFDWRVSDVHQTVTNRLVDNSLFVCSGYFGMGPPLTESGDVLALLDGLYFPFVIRRVGGDGRYRLIGSAYVHRGTGRWPHPQGGEYESIVLV